jgi:hypothetical protein
MGLIDALYLEMTTKTKKEIKEQGEAGVMKIVIEEEEEVVEKKQSLTELDRPIYPVPIKAMLLATFPIR